MIEDYKIVTGDSTSDLAVLVREALVNGWQPQGPAVICNGKYLQTMVKEKIDESLLND